MNIYSCVDSKNIDKIIVLFYSCYINSSKKDKLNFYLLIDEEVNFNDIPSCLNLKIKVIKLNNEWKNIHEQFEKYFYKQSSHCKHIMNFARFFIFDYFPEIDRIIYLDWDMIVQTDIFKLEEYYNKNNLVVAETQKDKYFGGNCVFLNIVDAYHLKNIELKKYYLLLKNKQSIAGITHNTKNLKKKYINTITNTLNKNNIYINLNNKTFNAGFFITSKDIFNSEYLMNLIKNIINIQIKHNYFRFGTQVIMNLLSNNIIFVNEDWNKNDESNTTNIIHWINKTKPWCNDNPIWFKYKNLVLKELN